MKTAELYIDIRPYLRSIKMWLSVARDGKLEIKIMNRKLPRAICKIVLYIVALQLWMLARHRILLYEGGK